MTIRLLIVDDSALMRRQLSQLFESQGAFSIRTARNGREAVEENLAFEPDVITLDINMPEMDGLTALANIMASRAVPVLMVSSLTEKGAIATLEAMAMGAFDYVPKPGGTISLTLDQVRDELLGKVRAAARTRRTAARFRDTPTPRSSACAPVARPGPSRARRSGPVAPQGVVVIGVSTGGPRALDHLLSGLPADFPLPVLVAQHMPASFTGPLAARLDRGCALEVVEVQRPMAIEAGKVYIARGGADMTVSRRAGRPYALPVPEASEHHWHPSVELLGRSVLKCYEPHDVIAVMLTGMGQDGADAFAEIHRQGGRTIAESAASAIVFGMPAELIARGGASEVLDLDGIAEQLICWVH